MAQWTVVKASQLSPAQLNTWWNANATGSSLVWEGDVTSLLVQLAGSGVFVDGSDPTRPLGVVDLTQSFPELVRRLGAICQTTGRNTTVSKQALDGLDWKISAQYQLTVPARVESSVSPGVALEAHPELVIDLTSGKAGLGAIRGNAPAAKSHSR
jgi:hypothetical protein